MPDPPGAWECVSRQWEAALVRRPDRGAGAQDRQQALEIDFLKGCLQRIEDQRMPQAVTGNPRSTGRSKKKCGNGSSWNHRLQPRALGIARGIYERVTCYFLLPTSESKITWAKRPVVSLKFVLFFPYPHANVTVSFAFRSI